MGERGQATVETVGLLPVIFVIVLGAAGLLAAGSARELADHAAEAGAVAMLEGSDPAGAARDALPGWAKDNVEVAIHGRRVRVTVTPPAPVVGDLLHATAEADAGASR
jgi:hypothetical protein